MSGGYITFDQLGDGHIRVQASTCRGQVVQNVVPADASADRVVEAVAMVDRRRRAWDRLHFDNTFDVTRVRS